MKFFLGIDVGTSSIKTGLWSADGHLAAKAVRTYPTHRPAPTWAEQDPMDWWRALGETIQEVLHHSELAASQIAGIGIDSTGWTFVPVDSAGNTLHNALIWQDRRATAEAAALRAHPDAGRLVALNANPIDEAYTTAKILWLRAHHPDIYKQTDQFLISSGFLVRKLTGISSCDHSQAYGFHCFDMTLRRWDEPAANILGLDLAKLPPLFPSCAVVGEVTRCAADELSLVPGIPVIAGGLDAAVGAFGSGVARSGTSADQGGTAFGLSIVVERVVVEPRLIFSPHVVPDVYLLQGGTVGGGALDWFRRELGLAEQLAANVLEDDVYSIMTAEAARSTPGANGLIFLPYMSGERSPIWNSSARGVFFGLNYGTQRADIIRALMEGCVFAVYHNMRVAAEAGAEVTEWIGIGGAANSANWCQLKADITNRPFTVTRRSNGQPGDNTLGLAVMAGYGTGHYVSPVTTIEEFLPERITYYPNPAHHAIYQDTYAIFCSLYERLIPEFEVLAAFSEKRRSGTE